MTSFQPNKYLTVKRQDIEDALNEHDKMVLNKLLFTVANHRAEAGKSTHRKYICVSDTDQNYKIVKRATVDRKPLCLKLNSWPTITSGGL